MRLLPIASTLLFAASASAATLLGPAPQANDPAHLVTTFHTQGDALQSARLENRADKSVVSYRVGWVLVEDGKTSLHEGAWIDVASGLQPGASTDVPAQGIALQPEAHRFMFYVSELRFADGSTWAADAAQMIERANR